RDELLGYLRRTAEALDGLYQAHRLQHLGLTPRVLVLVGGQLRILDFGLIELLWLPAKHQPLVLNTRYAAVELFGGEVSPACDQYSLALIYQELLTGAHPFRNLKPRQMISPRLRGQPDVNMLPATDHDAVLRALNPDPARRFRTCTDFVAALEGG